VDYLENDQRRGPSQSLAVRLRSSIRRGARMATGRADVWRLAPMAAFVAIVAIWEWRARAGGISTLFFPAPSAIARTLVEMVRSGEMFGLMGTTLSRLVVGLALGGTIGLVVGLLMGWSDNVRTAVDPIISAVHPVPKLALLPLLLIIFGLGDLPGIIIVAMAAFFPMAINSMAGVRHIPPIHFEVAQNYGAARRQVFKRIVWPGSLPFTLAGARLALNTGFVLTIAVEIILAQGGLGGVIWLVWQTLKTQRLYATLIVIAILGVSFNALLRYVSRRLVPWQAEGGS